MALICHYRYKTKISTDNEVLAAYAVLQATKPQTIGYGLNDSPAGGKSLPKLVVHSW